jgi:hypothetical protein
VALVQLPEGVENPLLSIPEYNQFQKNLMGWYVDPPTMEPLTVVGSYRLFDSAPVAVAA